MTDRQKTGIWFVITGILLASIWFLAYAIVNWWIASGIAEANMHMDNFTDEQKYMLGASAVVSLQFVAVTGIPLIITGLAQIILGSQNVKKGNKK